MAKTLFGMRRRKKREPGTEVELPITPMLDMAFQLFAFFVFLYHPSALEGQMQLNLPAQGDAKADSEQNVDPKSLSDQDLKLPSEITITIKSDNRDGLNVGIPGHFIVDTPEDVGHRLDSMEDLEKYLTKARGKLSNQEEVTIKADSRLKYAFVVQVMDMCSNPKKGGFKHVGFGPPPDYQPPKGK